MTYAINDKLQTVTWEALGDNETGATLRVNPAGLALSTVTMTGTFGGTVYLEGSNDGTNFYSLRDVRGNLIELTAAGLVELSTGARYIRARSGAGVSDVDVKVTLGV